MERSIVRHFLYPAFNQPPLSHLLNDQFAFRPTGSTTAAIVFLLHTVTQMLNTNSYVTVIATDLTKAFDTVRHKTLVYLGLYLIGEQTLKLILLLLNENIMDVLIPCLLLEIKLMKLWFCILLNHIACHSSRELIPGSRNPRIPGIFAIPKSRDWVHPIPGFSGLKFAV